MIITADGTPTLHCCYCEYVAEVGPLRDQAPKCASLHPAMYCLPHAKLVNMRIMGEDFAYLDACEHAKQIVKEMRSTSTMEVSSAQESLGFSGSDTTSKTEEPEN